MKTWAERNEAAKKRGHYTKDDKDRVERWPTCAVGEHHGEYKRWRAGRSVTPASSVLRDLGSAFAGTVDDDDIAEAELVYARIQAWFRRRRPATVSAGLTGRGGAV